MRHGGVNLREWRVRCVELAEPHPTLTLRAAEFVRRVTTPEGNAMTRSWLASLRSEFAKINPHCPGSQSLSRCLKILFGLFVPGLIYFSARGRSSVRSSASWHGPASRDAMRHPLSALGARGRASPMGRGCALRWMRAAQRPACGEVRRRHRVGDFDSLVRSFARRDATLSPHAEREVELLPPGEGPARRRVRTAQRLGATATAC